MGVSGTKKVSVFDPATGVVVQLNQISEETEITKDVMTVGLTGGNQQYSADDASAHIVAYDNEGFDQLKQWMLDGTKVQFVTYGIQEHWLWYESRTIKVKKQHESKVGSRNKIVIDIKAQGPKLEIGSGENLLTLLLGWHDKDSNGKVDGFFVDDRLSPSFSIGLQMLQNKGAQIGIWGISKALVYPISNVTMFSKVELQFSNVDGLNVSIQQIDRSNNIIGFAGGSLSVQPYTTIVNSYIQNFIVMSERWGTNQMIEVKDVYVGVPK